MKAIPFHLAQFDVEKQGDDWTTSLIRQMREYMGSAEALQEENDQLQDVQPDDGTASSSNDDSGDDRDPLAPEGNIDPACKRRPWDSRAVSHRKVFSFIGLTLEV